MRSFGWLLASLCAHVATASAAPPVTVRFALVIGYNGADTPGQQSLRYADDDAVATHTLLSEAHVQSVLLAQPDEDTAELHPDLVFRAPTRQAVSAALATIRALIVRAKKDGADTEFILFYSGHGDVDRGEGYVTLTDAHFTRPQLYVLLSQLGATRNHVVVDACRSYFLAFDRGPGGQRRPYTGPSPEASIPSQLSNTGFLLSTDSDRESHEWERFRGGIFSHEVRSGLRGAADTDRDGSITYAELGAFIEKANSKVLPRFRPEVLVRPPSTGFSSPLIVWPDQASLELAPSDWGHVYLESAQGERVLDVHPTVAAGVALHVPSPRPLFVRKHDQSLEYAVESRVGQPLNRTSGRLPAVAPRGALSLAFEGLFALPVTRSDAVTYAQRAAVRARVPSTARARATEQATRWPRVAEWTVGAAGAGMLAGALGSWLRARRSRAALGDACGGDALCPDDSGWQELQHAARQQLRWSHRLAAAGGVAVLSAVTLRWWPQLRANGGLRLAGAVHCGGTTTACGTEVVVRW